MLFLINTSLLRGDNEVLFIFFINEPSSKVEGFFMEFFKVLNVIIKIN